LTHNFAVQPFCRAAVLWGRYGLLISLTFIVGMSAEVIKIDDAHKRGVNSGRENSLLTAMPQSKASLSFLSFDQIQKGVCGLKLRLM
jgi:hypothetical protein